MGAAAGWNELLYRTWYLTGAVWTAGWLGLGTTFLLARTRFGYAVALCLLLAGLFTFLTQQRYQYPDAGVTPILYFAAGGVLAGTVAVLTYFQSDRWAGVALAAVVGATLLSLALGVTTPLASPGYVLDPSTGVPTADLFPGSLPPPDALAQHHRRAEPPVRGCVLRLRLHAQAPGAGLLARSGPAG